jgi:hypothetical protein
MENNDQYFDGASSDIWACPQCQTVSPAGTKFCVKCGHALSRECPKCHYTLPSTARYCHQCGTDIEAYLQEQALQEKAKQERENRWVREYLARGFEKVVCPSCRGEKGIWTDVCPECSGTGYLNDPYTSHDRAPIEPCPNCYNGHVSEAYFKPCYTCREKGYIVYDKAYVTKELKKQRVKKVINTFLLVLLAITGLAMAGMIIYGIVTFAFEYIFYSFGPGILAIILIALTSEPKSKSSLISSCIVYPPE